MAGGTKDAGLREAKNINRSLAALSDVLLALGKREENPGQHIPYRNSRLTHLLKDSIGGDAKMVMLLCVSATARFLSESVQTLRFGTRARAVQKGAPTKRTLPGSGDVTRTGGRNLPVKPGSTHKTPASTGRSHSSRSPLSSSVTSPTTSDSDDMHDTFI